MPAPLSRAVPWAPGPLTVEAQAFAQYRAYLGESRQTIYNDLVASFGADVTPQRAGQIANQAERVAAILVGFDQGGELTALRRQDLPRNPTLSNAYRFVAEIEYAGRDPDDGGQVFTARTVIIDTSRNLSRSEIEEQLQEVHDEFFDPDEGVSPRGRLDKEHGWQMTGFRTVSVERRT